MNNMKYTKNKEEEIFPATVVKVINDYKVVINRGSIHKVKEGKRFLFYKLGEEELKDPVSGKSLGRLELIKGMGKVVHVQERISTIESNIREPPKKRIIRSTPLTRPLLDIMGGSKEEVIITPSSRLVPFDNLVIGDKVKPI